MIPIAKPLIGQEEKSAVNDVLNSGMIAEGPRVKEFEENFAEFCGTKHAVAVNSGTAALHVALMAAGIKPGDEVITTPFSFIATGNSILMAGAKPVFCDIDSKTFNISPESIKEAISDKTRAIMPVHLFGQCADMSAINEIAQDSGVRVIEDACQAHAAEWKGVKAGALGDVAGFSFYPTKNMTTSEGGMVTTNDDKIAKMSRIYRNHGMARRYYHDYMGFNYRMTDICAAIGLAQLRKLDGFTKKRRDNANYLDNNLNGVVTPYVSPDAKHVYHQYTIMVENRDTVIEKLKEAEIGCGVYYPVPINEQTYYKELGYSTQSTPNSNDVAKKVLSLPVHPSVTEDNLKLIANTLNNIA